MFRAQFWEQDFAIVFLTKVVQTIPKAKASKN
jgi:hypothetical protein